MSGDKLEGMTQYVDDKFKAVAGEIQQVRKIANEMSKVQLHWGNYKIK
jgi:hypothetical protein